MGISTDFQNHNSTHMNNCFRGGSRDVAQRSMTKASVRVGLLVIVGVSFGLYEN